MLGFIKCFLFVVLVVRMWIFVKSKLSRDSKDKSRGRGEFVCFDLK